VPTGEPDVVLPCDEVLIAVGQENAFPWIERDAGIDFDRGACRCWTPRPTSRRVPKVFFGGDAAFGPKNIIWAVAHGHEAAVSIDRFLHGEDVASARRRTSTWCRRRWASTSGATTTHPATTRATRCPGRGREGAGQHQGRGRTRLRPATAWKEAQRCLNCDVQTVFTDKAVHRVRCLRRHLPDGLHQLHRQRRRGRPAHALKAPALNLTQDLYVSRR
jgi:formate dehydrogenase beta subunit